MSLNNNTFVTVETIGISTQIYMLSVSLFKTIHYQFFDRRVVHYKFPTKRPYVVSYASRGLYTFFMGKLKLYIALRCYPHLHAITPRVVGHWSNGWTLESVWTSIILEQ